MPGDPKECRDRAKRCWKLATEATNPALKQSFLDLSQQWSRLASSLETTQALLNAWVSTEDLDPAAEDATAPIQQEARQRRTV